MIKKSQQYCDQVKKKRLQQTLHYLLAGQEGNENKKTKQKSNGNNRKNVQKTKPQERKEETFYKYNIIKN